MHLYHRFIRAPIPTFKILRAAVSSTVGPHIVRCHHLQIVCLQDVVSVDQTDENKFPFYSFLCSSVSCHGDPTLFGKSNDCALCFMLNMRTSFCLCDTVSCPSIILSQFPHLLLS
ncbi:hypothetical protein TNCT_229361 [Trichonephila clavata]|uniref:Uncharacterized protein n=1 Tax=Trichonephila clavata TaxID=2740835 RepID=A0A8X6GH27_TRICU|nr:hypothetical protein TNCT_229361 [Trichonephila clavata]